MVNLEDAGSCGHSRYHTALHMSTMRTNSTTKRLAILCIVLGAHLALLWFFRDLRSRDQSGPSSSRQTLHVTRGASSSAHHPITLVTSYYPLSKGSRHSLEEYRTWMANFLPYTQSPVVMYMPPDAELEKAIRDLRGDLPLVIHKIPLWELPPIAPLEQDFKTWQYDMDPEKAVHCPEVYAIWNAKPWMLHETAKANTFDSSHVFWVDIGCWRNGPFRSWPSFKRVEEAFAATCGTRAGEEAECWNRMLLGSPVRLGGKNHVQATFFGGSLAAATWFAKTYYALAQEMLANGAYIGMEQNVMFELFHRYPDRCLLLRGDRAPFGDPWFFFQAFFASPTDIESLSADFRENLTGVIEAHSPSLVMLGEDVIANAD